MTPPLKSPRQSLVEFFGLRRSIVGLLAMVIFVGMGEHMAEQYLPLYLLALGAGAVSIGGLNALDNLFGALYSFPGGYVAHRFGVKRALLIFNLLALFGFMIVIVIPKWPAVFAGAVFFLSWTAISLPATMGLVAKALPKNKRTMGVSMHSLVRRVPMALGPIAGALIIQHFENVQGKPDGTITGVRVAFGAAALMCVVAAVMQQFLIEDDIRDDSRPAAEINPLKLWPEMSPALRRLLVADILVRFCEQIPYAFVVIWVTEIVKTSKFEFGMLRAVEMFTAIAIYVPVAYFADRSHKKPFVLATFIFFTLFPLALMYSRSFWLLLPAFVLRGLKEFGEPTRKALIMDLAPEGRKEGIFGLYYLIRDVIVAGAAFGGGYLWLFSPEANLWTAFAFGALGTLWFALYGADLGEERESP